MEKARDLAVDFVLALHQPEQLHHGTHRERRAVRVLPVCDAEGLSPALDLVREEGEVHEVCGLAHRQFKEPSKPGFEQLLLFWCESGSDKPDRVVWTGLSINQKHRLSPHLTDGFHEIVKLLVAV